MYEYIAYVDVILVVKFNISDTFAIGLLIIYIV